jgi:hypothetical protein
MSDPRRMENLVENVPYRIESKNSEGSMSPMSNKRIWSWTGRLLALLAAVIIPACGSTGGTPGQNPNGILWNSQVTGPPSGGTGGGSLWVNPNSGLGASTIGISNIITSADDATYSAYTATTSSNSLGGRQVMYIINNTHPLSTDTGSTSVTTRENALQGQINGYRQQQLGNVGAGGAQGGVAVGNITGIILSGHFKATKSARAHCKHYALNEQNQTLPPGTNVEGDNMQLTMGGPALQPTPLPHGYPLSSNDGRLGKIQVIAYDPAFTLTNKPGIIDGGSIVYSGVQYGEATAVFSRLLIDVPGVISALGWTHFAVGHWRGGRQEAYFWNIIFLLNPADAPDLQP